MYVAFAELGESVPATTAGTLITTFVFETQTLAPQTTLAILEESGNPPGRTTVYDGEHPNKDVTGTLGEAHVRPMPLDEPLALLEALDARPHGLGRQAMATKGVSTELDDVLLAVDDLEGATVVRFHHDHVDGVGPDVDRSDSHNDFTGVRTGVGLPPPSATRNPMQPNWSPRGSHSTFERRSGNRG